MSARVFSAATFHGRKNLFVGAGDKDILPRILRAQHGAYNFRYLLRSFALTENDFGKTLAERAVVIHLDEAEIFEREMLETLDGSVRSERANLHRFQNFQKFRLIHILRPQRILSSQTTIAFA